jgi:hypothetical protein
MPISREPPDRERASKITYFGGNFLRQRDFWTVFYEIYLFFAYHVFLIFFSSVTLM